MSIDDDDGDEIAHAIALFRTRGGGRNEMRSAVVALARILEDRRATLKMELFTKDAGALFEIANNFDLRHRTASQQADYPEAFLEWIFYWYLSTIRLLASLAE